MSQDIEEMFNIMWCSAAFVEACILINSALVGAYNVRILIGRVLCIPSWLGPFRSCRLREDDHLTPHLLRESLVDCTNVYCLEFDSLSFAIITGSTVQCLVNSVSSFIRLLGVSLVVMELLHSVVPDI